MVATVSQIVIVLMNAESRERSTFNAVAIPLAMSATVLISTYLVGFALLVLDEFVMNCVIWRSTPSTVREVVQVIYWPLIELVKNFL